MSAPPGVLVLALAQISSIVGDVAGNARRLDAARREAAAFGADLLLAPELFLSGYPPEDLVLKPAFQEACRAALMGLAKTTADGGPAVLVGLPWVEDGALHNAAALLAGGRVEALRFKVDLPNYGVFDEKRVFKPGPSPGPLVYRGIKIGVPICEDIWGPDPVECIHETGGQILLVPNASPYERDKFSIRENVAVARVVESGLPLIYLNSVGGQDEIVFDGASFGLNPDRSLAFQLPAFESCVARTVWRQDAGGWRCIEGPKANVLAGDEADYAACVLGLQGLRRQQRLSWRRARTFGRHRLGAVRRHGRRCPGPRPGARGDAALSLHLARTLCATRRLAPTPWGFPTKSPRSANPWRRSNGRWRPCSKAPRAI